MKGLAKQAPTRRVALQTIMARRDFAAGVDDVRSGRAARFDDALNDQWDYERGRQFALIAPMSMPLRIGRSLNPAALALFTLAILSKEIL